MKPLFIPLKTEHFNRFKNGSKKFEMRPYGARWHEGTCRKGRAVTLSRGYGKYERLQGTVTAFFRVKWEDVPESDQVIMFEIYKNKFAYIAVIGIELHPNGKESDDGRLL